MLKKFASSLLAVLLLTACQEANSTQASNSPEAGTPEASAPETSTETPVSTLADDTAVAIIADLDMSNMTVLKSRSVIGLFLAGDTELTSDQAGYMSSASGSSDCVAVFVTDYPQEVTAYVEEYMETLKAQAETYNPDEIFKITNAVLQSSDTMVILVVADDIEAAKAEVASFLN